LNGFLRAMDIRIRTGYVLLLMTTMHALAGVDRSVNGFLADPMTRDLHISDAQFGLIVGMGYIGSKLLFALPMARWVDRGNRTTIIFLCALLWSSTTMATGLVETSLQLLACRVLIGLGESNNSAYFSLISDFYPINKRAGAVGVFYAGWALATVVCFMILGPINEAYGWRWTMFSAGVPAILTAVLVRLTMKEPARGGMDNVRAGAAPMSVRAAATLLISQKSFLLLVIGFGIHFAGSGAILFWYPAFLARVQHLGPSEVGIVVGFVNGGCAFAGYLFGGTLVQRLSSNDERWKAYFPALVMVCYAPVTLFAAFVQNTYVSIFFFGVATLLMSSITASIYALGTSVLAPRARGLGAATIDVSSAFMDYGVSAYWSGALDDWLIPAFGQQSMRVIFVPAAATALIAALFFGVASRYVTSDLKRI
jgi:predicted MFS family arabinose efflux permease